MVYSSILKKAFLTTCLFVSEGISAQVPVPVSKGNATYYEGQKRFPTLSVIAAPTGITTHWAFYMHIEASITTGGKRVTIPKGTVFDDAYAAENDNVVSFEKTGSSYSMSDVKDKNGMAIVIFYRKECEDPKVNGCYRDAKGDTITDYHVVAWNVDDATGEKSAYTYIITSYNELGSLSSEETELRFCPSEKKVKITIKIDNITGKNLVWYDSTEVTSTPLLSISVPTGSSTREFILTDADFDFPQKRGDSKKYYAYLETGDGDWRSAPLEVTVRRAGTKLTVRILNGSYWLVGEDLILETNKGYSKYIWSFYQGKKLTTITTTINQITLTDKQIKETTVIFVKGYMDNTTACPAFGSYLVEEPILMDFDVDLGVDKKGCNGDKVKISNPWNTKADPDDYEATYIWKKKGVVFREDNVADTSFVDYIEASASGQYSLQIKYKYKDHKAIYIGKNDPENDDSDNDIFVSYSNLKFEVLPLKCSGENRAKATGRFEPIDLKIDGVSQNGDSVDFTGMESKVYVLTATDAEGCTISEEIDFVKKYQVPSYFSPNGDGINDTWNPNFAGCGDSLKLAIYDRYGHQVYSGGVSGAWDGTKGGKKLPEGDYWYMVYFNNGVFTPLKGHITLKRR